MNLNTHRETVVRAAACMSVARTFLPMGYAARFASPQSAASEYSTRPQAGTFTSRLLEMAIIGLAVMLFCSSAANAQTNDAVSREVSVFNFGEASAPVEAISREVSLFNFGSPSAAVEAVSRELSVFNFGAPSATIEAVSREVSVFNFGEPSVAIEAISREVSVLNNVSNAPVITTQPQDSITLIGTTAQFSVAAVGDGPLSYQWRMSGTNLFNSGQISGASTNALAIGSVQAANAGAYDVVIANAYGSVTSTVASLTVMNVASYSGVLAGWDVSGLVAYGPSPLQATTNAPNLTATGLTRASGLASSLAAALLNSLFEHPAATLT